MRRSSLGSLQVSVVGLGCNNFGRALDRSASAAVVATALEAGINVFDVADNYGEGKAESYLGAALGEHSDQVVITTKFGMPVPGVSEGGARPDYLRSALERSLGQLGRDHIDLYLLHRPDPEVPVEDVLAELNRQVDAGKVREIGCSNFDSVQLGEAMAAPGPEGTRPFLANQVEYSLLHRHPETEGLADLCEREGVALLPFYPLASGLLTGKARPGQIPEGRLQMERYQRFLTAENYAIVESLREFSAERGVTMVQVAIGWLLAQATVPFVAAGATRPEQVVANAAAAEWQPSSDDLRLLDQLTRPGSGRGGGS
jgi:aryl-alcohol dehydrogenase-like predicted oxidoreductase